VVVLRYFVAVLLAQTSLGREASTCVRPTVNVEVSGTYALPVNCQNFPKVQVITVAQLLKGDRQ
jgi:hypothetical protein